MWRSILSALLLFWVGFPAASPTIPALSVANQGTEGFALYFPLVSVPAVVEAVSTASFESNGYPISYSVIGYVRNLTTEPLYGAVVDLEITIWPYGDPPPPPYTEIVQVTPALTATLPGQFNPFEYNLLLGKASASIGPIRGVSANPETSGDRFASLTVLESSVDGAVLSGTVRNSTEQTLHHARVIVFDPNRCGWQEAGLETDTLQPGQETIFSIGSYSVLCPQEDPFVIGQGAIQP